MRDDAHMNEDLLKMILEAPKVTTALVELVQNWDPNKQMTAEQQSKLNSTMPG